MSKAVGILELSSIAKGMETGDAMLKSANVELLVSKTLCPGKCYMVVAGDISDVNNAVSVASERAGEKGLLVYRSVIARPHEAMWRQMVEG